MRDCVIDSKDAVRYLAKTSAKLKLDPARFCMMGDSAGGHIARCCCSLRPRTLAGDKDLAADSYKMLAGVSWYGPCDFEKTDLFNHDDRADSGTDLVLASSDRTHQQAPALPGNESGQLPE